MLAIGGHVIKRGLQPVIKQLIRPDILVKGEDHQDKDVVGQKLVESYGGRVELIRFVEDESTSNIIGKILSRFRDTG